MVYSTTSHNKMFTLRHPLGGSASTKL